MGNRYRATALNMNTVPMATEISASAAPMERAVAAMADPPQIAVPADTSVAVERFRRSRRRNPAPNRKVSAMVAKASRNP